MPCLLLVPITSLPLADVNNMPGRGRRRQTDTGKRTRAAKKSREEKVKGSVGFSLLPEFHPLHLDLGGRTLPGLTT